MINAEQVLKTIRLTEKSNQLSSNYGQYTFEVYPTATKHTVRAAVEQTFKVTVTRVNIQNRKGKPKRSRMGRPDQGVRQQARHRHPEAGRQDRTHLIPGAHPTWPSNPSVPSPPPSGSPR